MKKAHLFTLLSVVKNNGDIQRLRREGLEYIEIAELTNEAIKQKYLLFEENKLQLTDKGDFKLNHLGESLRKYDKSNWIEKEEESKIPKLDKNFIFLPNQKELDF